MENTIIAFNTGSPPLECGGSRIESVTCCDIYGHQGSDWHDCLSDFFGIDGNISEDPLFCDAPSGDLRLSEGSPCAPFTPPNEECDLIGAWPVGCEPTAIEWTTWGRIKTQYSH